jgi:hypothetical protein
MPEMIWYPTHAPVVEVEVRVLINPVPMVTNIVPAMAKGR